MPEASSTQKRNDCVRQSCFSQKRNVSVLCDWNPFETIVYFHGRFCNVHSAVQMIYIWKWAGVMKVDRNLLVSHCRTFIYIGFNGRLAGYNGRKQTFRHKSLCLWHFKTSHSDTGTTIHCTMSIIYRVTQQCHARRHCHVFGATWQVTSVDAVRGRGLSSVRAYHG